MTLVLAVAALTMVGWVTGIDQLTRIYPKWPPMTPWTALWLAALVAAILVQSGHPSRGRAWAGRGLAATVGVITVMVLAEYAGGEAVDFSGVPLDLDYLTPLGRRVVAACRNIPRGEVRTYGELAELCGAPGAARAVGSVMAKNRHPLVVPCHRVIGAAGSLGGYSAPSGLTMKRRLLAMEGARLT